MEQYFSPAFHAVMNDDLPLLKEYYNQDKGIINDLGFFDGTLLHYAACTSSPEMVKFLIEKNMEVEARSINKETPLQWAMYRGNTPVIQTLVDHGAQINHVFDIWGNSVLTAAVLTNSNESVHALIQLGADVNEKNPKGRTPLHTAVGPANERINLNMVQLLINYRADVNAVQNDGVSVLMWAVKYANVQIVELLLEKGARVEPTGDKVKCSVLHNALSTNKLPIIDLILAITDIVNFTDASGKTPLILAVEKGQIETVKKLIAKKADIHAVDDYFGKTALHTALMCGYEDIATYLLTLDVANTALDIDNRVGIWYLGHSGWAIKTPNHFLVFDYASNSKIPQIASLAKGYIVPDALKDLNVTVFVSNRSPDHFDPQICEWANTIKQCTYVYGFNPNKITPYSGPSYQQVELNQTMLINGIEVTTLLSNVGGAGFLIDVDGITIFHPGDHSEREADHTGPYCSEIDFIAAKKSAIDIAFLPVQGDYLADEAIVYAGNAYAIQRLAPAVVFPMHADGKEYLYDDFIRYAKPLYSDVQFNSARYRGDCFLYHKQT